MFVNSSESVLSAPYKDKDICMQDMGVAVISHQPIGDEILTKPSASSMGAYDNPIAVGDD